MSINCKHGRKAWKCRICNTAEAAAYKGPDPESQAIAALLKSSESYIANILGEFKMPRNTVSGADPMQATRDSDYIRRIMQGAFQRDISYIEGAEIINEYLAQKYGPGITLDGPPRMVCNKPDFGFPTTNGMRWVSEQAFYEWLCQGRSSYANQARGGGFRGGCKPREITLNHRKLSDRETETLTWRGPPMLRTSLGQSPPGVDWAEMEMRVAEHLGISIPGARAGEVVENIYGQITSENPFNEVCVVKGMVLQIEHSCTMHIGEKKLRVVKEGDKLILVDEGFKKLC
jgi:hypothetical protein